MKEYGKKDVDADIAKVAVSTGVNAGIVKEASGIASIVALIVMADPTKEGLMKATGAVAIWIDKMISERVEAAIKAKSDSDTLLAKMMKPQNAYEQSLYIPPEETAAALNAAYRKGYNE